jgi:hypothetical protein
LPPFEVLPRRACGPDGRSQGASRSEMKVVVDTNDLLSEVF